MAKKTTGLQRRFEGVITLMPDHLAKAATTLFEAGAKDEMARFANLFSTWNRYIHVLEQRRKSELIDPVTMMDDPLYKKSGALKAAYVRSGRALRKSSADDWWQNPKFADHKDELQVIAEYLMSNKDVLRRLKQPPKPLKEALAHNIQHHKEINEFKEIEADVKAAEFDGLSIGERRVEGRIEDMDGNVVAFIDEHSHK